VVRRLGALALLLLPVFAGAQAPASGDIAALLAERGSVLLPGTAIPGEREQLRAAYAAHAQLPFWSAEGTPTPAAEALLRALASAPLDYGMPGASYGRDAIAALLAATPLDGARLDLALSSAALRLLQDLHFGRIAPRSVGFDLDERRAPLVAAELLPLLARLEEQAKVFAALEPQFGHYQLLKAALPRYRALAAQPQLTALPAMRGASVRSGEDYAGAPALRTLLLALGDLDAEAAGQEGTTFDAALAAGLQRFQERHGLDADGALGRRTLAALTTPLAQRLRQIELTLERWRWLPEFRTPPIIVNIPQFRMFVFGSTQDRAADILQIPVIVGKAYPKTQTPVFVGDMRYVVIRPYWDVPASILRAEMLPALARNPNYFERNRLEIVSGAGDDARPVPQTEQNVAALARGALRLRQRPGADNALGLIKFMLPNGYNVYLHSTPAQELFQRSQRAFSHTAASAWAIRSRSPSKSSSARPASGRLPASPPPCRAPRPSASI
jgi:murein L,D-transpeptidase YcbB/YkuD